MPTPSEFPRVRSLKGALPLLRRPPVPAAVRFKPLTDLGERCRLAAYTDVRFVIDLLNAVCGAHWHADYQPLPVDLRGTPQQPEDPPMLYVGCALTVFGVTRSDVGEGRNGTTHGAGPKAAQSDALKRAAVQFGVNQALYALRTVWLDVHPGTASSCPYTHVARSRAGHLWVPDGTLRRLRELYQRWLEEGSGRSFGAPIDLGEDVDALGLEPDGGAEATPGTPDDASPERRYGSPPSAADGSTPDANVVTRRVIRVGAAAAETAVPRPAAVRPSTPAQRADVRHAALQAGIEDDQLGLLAHLLCGERILDRLGEEALGHVRYALEIVVDAGVAPTAFIHAMARAAAKPEPGAATEALRRWLLSQSERAGHGGRAAA